MEKLLLISGGLDSVIAYHVLNKPQTIFFNIGVPYNKKELQFVNEYIPETIIDNSIKLKEEKNNYIPFRNILLLTRAATYSDNLIISTVKEDIMPDNNKKIFDGLSKILSKVKGSKVTITSPFFDLTKVEIVKLFIKHKWDKETLNDTVSCYNANLKSSNYCGECLCCFKKWVAFTLNKIDIPFHNLELMAEQAEKATHNKYIPEYNLQILKAIKMQNKKKE